MSYCFEGVDGDVVGQFDESEQSEEVVIVLHFIDFAEDKFS